MGSLSALFHADVWFQLLCNLVSNLYSPGEGSGGAVAGHCAGLPLLLSVPADLCGGIVTDFLTRNAGLRWGRCMIGRVFPGRGKCLSIHRTIPAGGGVRLGDCIWRGVFELSTGPQLEYLF